MTVESLSDSSGLATRSCEYLDYLERWLKERPNLPLSELLEAAGGAEQVALVSVDLIVGFCHVGPLSSPRVASVLPAVTDLMQIAHAAGVHNIILTQDTHRPDAEEFASYPPHCVADTEESLTAPELSALSFAHEFVVAKKNSISSVTSPAYLGWEKEHGPFSTYVVVGDCTDLCVYQAAMAIKTRSQANHLGQRVIVPVNCIETYDLPVSLAASVGAHPHPGDLLHHVFLHHMAQNGVDVVAGIV